MTVFIIIHTPAKPKGVIYESVKERLKMGSEFETKSELSGLVRGRCIGDIDEV